jgi:uncharacterized protein (DUF362 family)
LKTNLVAAVKSNALAYPNDFSPNNRYPEYQFEDLSTEGLIYDTVREALHLLGLNAINFGLKEWNPFVLIVHPGDRVIVKPNLVIDYNASGETTDCLVTHASVLRPVIDYVLLALKGEGSVAIADSAHGNANFARIKQVTGLDILQAYYSGKGINIDVLDLRKYHYGLGPEGFIEKRKRVDGDPDGYCEVDLGKDSAFADLPHLENLYGADFDRSEIRRFHNAETNKYVVARTFLCADVIINVPKLKTHKKIGATLNLKSLIGINGDKNCLPHFRINDPIHGGDEYPNLPNSKDYLKRRFKRLVWDLLLGSNRYKLGSLYKLLKHFHGTTPKASVMTDCPAGAITAGNWHGNRTVHRTVYDLSKIIIMADKNGLIRETPQRRIFSIIDGIIAGEKEGPLNPSPKPCGVIISGSDPVAVDLVATRLMGFDAAKMPVYSQLSNLPPNHPLHKKSPEEIEVASNLAVWRNNIFRSSDRFLSFIPHSGWKNYLEISEDNSPKKIPTPTLSPVKI